MRSLESSKQLPLVEVCSHEADTAGMMWSTFAWSVALLGSAALIYFLGQRSPLKIISVYTSIAEHPVCDRRTVSGQAWH